MSDEHSSTTGEDSASTPLDQHQSHTETLAQDERTKRSSDLTKHLRDEAYAVRDCFTRYSVQGIAVAIFGLGAILKLNPEPGQELLGLLSGLIIVLMFTIARMGTHKYATSNRLLGYELYLQRLSRYPQSQAATPEMYDVGWEELMSAWRIVQATVFEKIYGRSSFFRLEREPVSLAWFKPKDLVKLHGASYHAGDYLRDILYVILAIIMICLGTMIHSLFQVMALQWDIHIKIFAGAVVLIMLLFSLSRGLRIYGRLRNLERELLSIYSCSIVWELTTVVHLSALKMAEGTTGTGSTGRIEFYECYLEELSKGAVGVPHNHSNIHNWLREERIKLRSLSVGAGT